MKEDYEKNSIKGKKLDYLELEIVHKNYKLSYNNYIIGLFETDGKSKIRMVYTLYQPNNYLKDKKKLIISPGDKKYYSFCMQCFGHFKPLFLFAGKEAKQQLCKSHQLSRNR